MPDQNDVTQIFPSDEVGNILHVSLETHFAAQKTGAVRKARQGRCEYLVPLRRQPLSHARRTQEDFQFGIRSFTRRKRTCTFSSPVESSMLWAVITS